MSYNGPIISYNGPIISYDGPIISYDGPIISYNGPIISYDGPLYLTMAPLYPALAIAIAIASLTASPRPSSSFLPEEEILQLLLPVGGNEHWGDLQRPLSRVIGSRYTSAAMDLLARVKPC